MTKNLNHQGEPLAHLFSTKEDGTTLRHFLKALQDECGKLQCKVFMSDSAPQYFQSWSSVMVDKSDDPPIKLLCAWHVIEAFRNNLNKVKCAAKRENVINELLTDENTGRKRIRSNVSKLQRKAQVRYRLLSILQIFDWGIWERTERMGILLQKRIES